MQWILDRRWGGFGFGNGQFAFPRRVEVFQGEVYCPDQIRHDVQVFDLGGSFRRKWGSLGAGDGNFNFPHAASGYESTSHGSEVFVCDGGNNRIQVFSNDGMYKRKWSVTSNPTAILVDTDEVFVGRSGIGSSIIQVYDLDGNLLRTFGGAHTSSVQAFLIFNGEIYCASSVSSWVEVFLRDGTYLRGWDAGAGLAPWGLADYWERILTARWNPGINAVVVSTDSVGGDSVDEIPRIDPTWNSGEISLWNGEMYLVSENWYEIQVFRPGMPWLTRDYAASDLLFYSEGEALKCKGTGPTGIVVDADVDEDGGAWPTFDLRDGLPEGTYVRNGSAYYAWSPDHGRTWKVETIPGTYSAQSSAADRHRRVFCGWTGGQWRVRVKAPGRPWSGETNMALALPTGQGALSVDPTDASLTFTYRDTTGAWRTVRCNALGDDGTGVWR